MINLTTCFTRKKVVYKYTKLFLKFVLIKQITTKHVIFNIFFG
jgi:hypothetical protein